MTSVGHEGAIWLGLDVHTDSIAAGVLGERDSTPRIELVGPDPDAVRRLIKKVSSGSGVIRACYEAGPTGYELHRLFGPTNTLFLTGDVADVAAEVWLGHDPSSILADQERAATNIVGLALPYARAQLDVGSRGRKLTWRPHGTGSSVGALLRGFTVRVTLLWASVSRATAHDGLARIHRAGW
jgi:hypothetical protein